jgi:predicted DNA-binding transcriptional regulator AlpA
MAKGSVRDNQLIASAALREMLGEISAMTLWRWETHRQFPRALRIGKRKYWKLADVDAWLERQPRDGPL